MSDSDQLDIIICIVPKIDPDAPTVGPAVLKSHLMAAGFSCEVIDINIKLFKALKEKGVHERYYFEDDLMFSLHRGYDRHHPFVELPKDFVDFCDEYSYIFDEWIELFKQKNPKWIGLSILTFYSLSMAVKLSRLIRAHLPQVKIVWGGSQIEKGIETFKEQGLMDHYVYGDAEFSLIELLKGNTSAKGIDSLKPNQIDLNKALIPNYDDIDWSEYHPRYETEESPIYITGSKGCVKKCTFCNVNEIWPEYRFRSGKKIAKEMIALKQRYNRTEFRFTDSLINGSMKSFREMMHELREYRKTDERIGWTSQWIIRPKNQSPEEDFALMKESGCTELHIGLESFSQSVRWHMGKKFTDEDMWWSFEMLQKYKIKHILLMMVGYPTETEDDHQITLKNVRKLFDLGYVTTRDERGNDMIFFGVGHTLMLWEGWPLWDKIKDGLNSYEDMLNWDYKGNDTMTRIRRYKEIYELLHEHDKKSYEWMHKRVVRMLEEQRSRGNRR